MAVIVKSEEESGQKEYLVEAVIRKKIIFKSRPKPIIPSTDLPGK